MNLQGQDWGEVVIRKKKPTAAQSQTEASVNAVRLVQTCRCHQTDVAARALNPFFPLSFRRGDQVQKLTLSKSVSLVVIHVL